jgi:hypothetical protein
MEDNLEPILLFKILQVNISEKITRGVFYIPQRGVGIEGFRSDGSVVSIAKHIINSPGVQSIIPGEINPELNLNKIIQTISDWLREEPV